MAYAPPKAAPRAVPPAPWAAIPQQGTAAPAFPAPPMNAHAQQHWGAQPPQGYAPPPPPQPQAGFGAPSQLGGIADMARCGGGRAAQDTRRGARFIH